MSNRKVTFIIWSMFDEAGSRNYIEATKVIDAKSPIRNVALDIIKSLKNPKINLGVSKFDLDDPLIIKPLPTKANIKKFVDNDTFGFGVKYQINTDGSLRILDGLESLQPWTIDEFDQLSELGYIDYKKDHVVVVIPEGLGASGFDSGWLIAMTHTIADIITIGSVAISLPKFIKTTFRWFFDSPARKLAKQWAKQGIRYPEQLREFVDVKGEWKLSEIKTRLKLDEEGAVKLLVALGLEPIKNTWRLPQSKNSISKRRRWIANENKWKKRYG